jgi:hypothetical protein
MQTICEPWCLKPCGPPELLQGWFYLLPLRDKNDKERLMVMIQYSSGCCCKETDPDNITSTITHPALTHLQISVSCSDCMLTGFRLWICNKNSKRIQYIQAPESLKFSRLRWERKLELYVNADFPLWTLGIFEELLFFCVAEEGHPMRI